MRTERVLHELEESRNRGDDRQELVLGNRLEVALREVEEGVHSSQDHERVVPAYPYRDDVLAAVGCHSR